MKYAVLTPLKHDGKRLEEGESVHLKECAATDRLVQLGAIEPMPTRNSAAPAPAPALAPTTPVDPAASAPVDQA